MPDSDAYTDVVELCALLQCLGFSVKSLDSNDGNMSQDSGARTVAINCRASGLKVVLESPTLSCSCPAPTSQQNSGVWQVSGVAGGKELDTECGSTLIGSLPKSQQERLTVELNKMIRCIRQHGDFDVDRRREDKSASMTDLKTPEKILQNIEAETPTRYRSLDTLTGKSAKKESDELPPPGALRARVASECEEEDRTKKMVGRQSTYTVSSTPGSIRRKNKTSSPIQLSHQSVLETLISAQRAAEEVSNKINNAVRMLVEEGRDDSSMSSLALDVSKISVLKAAECSRAQFASSPNLSGIGSIEDSTKSRLKRFESASTSNLDHKLGNKVKGSRLSRISPNIFKKDSSASKDKPKSQDGRSKLQNLFKTKIATPVRMPQGSPALEASPNLSNSSRNKYSHVKSTIPRPAKKE